MPRSSKKHRTQEPITLPQITEGMNTTTAPHLLPSGQAAILENFYYDYSSGALRTRWPFRKYTNNVLNGSPATGITKWNNKLYFVSGQKLYYLDNSKNAHYVGSIGTTLPCMVPFHGYLQIASGIGLQRNTSADVLSTVTGTSMPTTLTQILELNQSLFGIGNTSYPDYLQKSGVRDETLWVTGTAAQYALTYEEEPSVSLTDLTITAISKGPSGTFIISKRGGGKKSTGYLDPNETSPVWRTVSSNECARTWRGQVYVAGRHWMMDDFSPMAIEGVDDSSVLQINQASLEIGSRISSSWVLDNYAYCVVYPLHSQVWFFPNISSDVILILHYAKGTWTRLKPSPGLRFYSSFYDSGTQTFYHGNKDGHIYTYDISGEGNFQDNPGGVETDYPQILKTAVYDPFPRNLCIFKSPSISYRTLNEGTGTIYFYQNYGVDPIYDDFAAIDFTISSSYPTMGDYDDETLLAHADEYLYVSDVQTTKIPFKSPAVNTVQLDITINSGAIELKDINVDIAMGRKK